MNMKLDFVKEKTSRCFWLMFLPVMAAMFLNMAYNVVDSLWIGNLLGENAYAALTSSAPVVLILNSAAMGAANGVAIVAARALGTGCKEMAESVISTSFFMALAFSVSVTGITELLIPVILKALNTPLETLVMSTQYLSIYVLGYVCVFLYCYFTAVLRSFGNSVFQMTAMLVCTALNGVLDPVFIHFMGFKGAAVATVISQGLCLVFMIVYMFRKKYFCLRIKMCKKMYVKEIILKALPSAFQQSIPAVSTSFLTALVSSYGVTAIAAYGITGKLEILLFYPAMALNMVLSSMVGQCAGAGRYDKASGYLKYSLKSGTIIMLILSAAVVGFAGPLSGLFVRSAAVAAIVKRYFLIVSIGYVLNTITNCCLGTLNGFGKPLKSMLLMVLYYIIVRMPLAWLMDGAGTGLDGIWTAVLISHVVACAAAYWQVRKQQRRLPLA